SRMWQALRLPSSADAGASDATAQAVLLRITSSVLRALYPAAGSAHRV
ncbi:MAG: hypothetical protein JWP93_1212, partial [Polaromonas sp.]|nr:hypothetical protein [Polaromonas sp.]